MEQFPRAILKGWAVHQPEVRALGVFGSRATGKATSQSDLDLWVEMIAPEDECLLVFLDNREAWRRELSIRTGLVVTELELRGVSDCAVGGIEVFRRAG